MTNAGKGTPESSGQGATTPLYRMDGATAHPSPLTGSPWSAEAQHGGPPCGLLARALEELAGELRPVKLSVDLVRAVPRAPLEVVSREVRRGRRVLVAEAELRHEERVVAVARGSFLLSSDPSDHDDFDSSPGDVPAWPDDVEPVPMIAREMRERVPPGFHFGVEVLWVRRGPAPVVWIRMPMSLVEGEGLTPFQRVATLSDFSNALGQRGRHAATGKRAGFINTDSTILLSRLSEGEWIGFVTDRVADEAGVGTVESVLYDRRGRIGRSMQARLAQSRGPGFG